MALTERKCGFLHTTICSPFLDPFANIMGFAELMSSVVCNFLDSGEAAFKRPFRVRGNWPHFPLPPPPFNRDFSWETRKIDDYSSGTVAVEISRTMFTLEYKKVPLCLRWPKSWDLDPFSQDFWGRLTLVSFRKHLSYDAIYKINRG